MKIKDLPNGLRQLAEFRNIENEDRLRAAFGWAKSDEGFIFWHQIDDGNFQPFYYKYGKEPNNRWFWMDKKYDYNYLMELFEDWSDGHSITGYGGGIFQIHDTRGRLFEGNLKSTIEFIKEQLKPKEPVNITLTEDELLEIVNNWSMSGVSIKNIYDNFKNVKPS